MCITMARTHREWAKKAWDPPKFLICQRLFTDRLFDRIWRHGKKPNGRSIKSKNTRIDFRNPRRPTPPLQNLDETRPQRSMDGSLELYGRRGERGAMARGFLCCFSKHYYHFEPVTLTRTFLDVACSSLSGNIGQYRDTTPMGALWKASGLYAGGDTPRVRPNCVTLTTSTYVDISV